MISKHAVREFLQRNRADYRQWKKLSLRELRSRKDRLPVRPPIWKKLRRHQKVCFLIGAETGRFGYFLDTGTGKTLIAIALVRYFRRLGKIRRVLVLVPNKLNTGEWVDEVRKHSPKARCRILSGSSKRKWEQLEGSKASFAVTTYGGFTRMVCKRELIKKGKKKKNRLVPDPRAVRRLIKAIDGLILDESTFVKNHRKLPYRICRKLSKTFQIVFALTGTPFGRDPQDLWAQLYLLDHGETLGATLGLFREALFTTSQNYWGGYEYTLKKKSGKILHRCLANRTIRYKSRQADLPHVTEIVKTVRLPSDTDVYYQQARDQLIAARGNVQEQKNAFMRMRQISSGFIGYFDDEEGIRAQHELSPNPKLELLLDLINRIGPDHKVIIFHDFRFSGSMICRELKKIDVQYARVYGGTKDPLEELRRFKEDPDCQSFVLNSFAGAYGLNLQMVKYVLWYESPVSVILRTQTRRRVEREGSEHDKIFLYDLVVENTVDQQILDFHAQGRDLFKAIVEGRVRV